MPAAPDTERLWDVVVVGAGPAGSTCAREAARQGLATQILEKRPWPRYKACGGGLIGRAVDLLDTGIEPAIERQTYLAELHLHDLSRSWKVRHPRPLVSMCMRAALDELLVTSACQAGARFASGCALRALTRHPHGWTLETGGGRLRTRWVVAADGADSTVARLTGWPRQRRVVPALESEITVDSSTLDRYADAARFDFGLVPEGYAWLFPKASHLSVGCLSFGSGRHQLRRHLERFLEALAIRPRSREDHGFVIPVRPRARRLASDRILLIGDAAGLADPVTCEGISYAVASGKLAAAALMARQDRVCAVYQRRLDRTVLGELRRARLLARLLYRTPRLRGFVFDRAGQALAEAVAAVVAGDSTYRQLLGSPRRYLRLGRMLFGSG